MLSNHMLHACMDSSFGHRRQEQCHKILISGYTKNSLHEFLVTPPCLPFIPAAWALLSTRRA